MLPLTTVETTIAVLTGGGTVVGVLYRYAWCPARRGITRVKTGLVQVETMSLALGKNGGKSLADSIGRIESRGLKTDDTVRRLEARVTALSDVQARPLFETDIDGKAIRFNRAAELLLGYTEEQLLGMGWVTVIDPGDRERVMQEWHWGIVDRRFYRIRARLICSAGPPIDVLMVAQPSMDTTTGKPIGWFGAIEVIRAEQKTA